MTLFQKLYKLETRQFLPISMDEAWDFFSSPENLKEITPDHMGFIITSKNPKKMYKILNKIFEPLIKLYYNLRTRTNNKYPSVALEH